MCPRISEKKMYSRREKFKWWVGTVGTELMLVTAIAFRERKLSVHSRFEFQLKVSRRYLYSQEA